MGNSSDGQSVPPENENRSHIRWRGDDGAGSSERHTNDGSAPRRPRCDRGLQRPLHRDRALRAGASSPCEARARHHLPDARAPPPDRLPARASGRRRTCAARRSITTISSVSAAAPWRTPSCARLPRSKRSRAGTASAPSRTSSRSTAPAGTACELDRDPARLADRPVHAGRRDRRAAAASRADDADRAHGRDRDRSRALRGAAGGDRRGRQRRSRHRARRARLPDLLPRRAGARPASPRRRGSGSRSRAGRRAGRGRALDAQLHRRTRDRPRVRRQHDDRDPRVRGRRRARLRGRHEHGQLHPQPERQPAARDDLARCRCDRAPGRSDGRGDDLDLRVRARAPARALRGLLPVHGRDRPASGGAPAPVPPTGRAHRSGVRVPSSAWRPSPEWPS